MSEISALGRRLRPHSCYTDMLRCVVANAGDLVSDLVVAMADRSALIAWSFGEVRRRSPTPRPGPVQGQRTHALERMALLEELGQLVMRGVTSGSLTLTADIDSGKGY